MDIKEESCFPDVRSENEGDTKNLVKKVKIETVTSSSDITSEVEDSTCSESEKHHLMRFNETIKESEIDIKIDIKEEDCWLRRADSYTNDGIKDEADEDVYSTKPPRLVPEIKNSNITCSNNFEMDPIKEEESFLDDISPHNETEFFRKVVTMKRNSDAVLVDDCCYVPIKTEIKSEAPFTKHLIKQIKSEAVPCSSSWEIDRKAVIDEGTLISDFGSQSKEAFLPEDPVAKLGKFNSGEEIGNKIKIKEEPLWPQTETSDMRDDIKDGDLPAVNSSSFFKHVSSYISHSFSSRDLGNDISFNMNKDGPECEGDTKCKSQKSVVTDISLQFFKTEKLNHEGIKQRKCNICKKAFAQLKSLKRHTLIHEGIKPHKCNICNKAFTHLSNLRNHKFIHEGTKPHQCNICNKAFTHLSKLRSHKFIHEGIKPHKCNLCNKGFTDSSYLKTHKFNHERIKPHKCNICNKAFTHISSLKRHTLIHEGIKPHKCNVCNKAFTELSNLKRHTLVHQDK